jgi:hypothetical protein
VSLESKPLSGVDTCEIKKCSKKPQSKKQQRHLRVAPGDLLEAIDQRPCENAERHEKNLTNGCSLLLALRKV